ncbi:hypothetical protein ACFSQ7_50630 [Paenibacillus rhizoplanae]
MILVFNFDVIFSSLDEAELGILKTIFIIAAINVAVSFPLNIFSSIITAYERFVYLKIINLIRVVLSPAMMVLVLLFDFRSTGMVTVALVLNLTIGVINVVFLPDQAESESPVPRLRYQAVQGDLQLFFLYLIVVDCLSDLYEC